MEKKKIIIIIIIIGIVLLSVNFALNYNHHGTIFHDPPTNYYLDNNNTDNSAGVSGENIKNAKTSNYDDSGVVTLIGEGLTTGNYMYIDIETNEGTKQLAINSMFKDKINEGDTIYFNYAGTYVDDYLGKYLVIIPLNPDGSSLN